MPLFCCFKKATTQESPPIESYLKRLNNSSRSLYYEEVCGVEMDEKWARLILNAEYQKYYHKALMLLRPGPSENQVTLDTISGRGKIQSLDIEVTVEDNGLQLNGIPAHDFLEPYERFHEAVFLEEATIKKVEKAKLKAIADLNQTNPQYKAQALNDPYIDVMKLMVRTIHNHTSFMEIGTIEEAEELLQHSDTVGSYITWEGRGETPSPVRRTLEKKPNKMQHYVVSYKVDEETVEHYPFCVDREGNIIDKKRSLTFTHFADMRKGDKGKAFIPSLIENPVPIGLVRTLSQSSITYSGRK